MKREVMFVFIFALIFISVFGVYASEDEQVENAYLCLQNKINQSNCSSFSVEEKIFLTLATQNENCITELINKNLSNMTCWQEQGKTGCSTKLTAQAILALDRKINTINAETWLLKQTKVPDNIYWYLEIETLEPGVAICDITYSGKTYTISIGLDKKINQSAGPSLTISLDNPYWLKILPAIYNKNIDISCNKQFITTLLFKKEGLSTIHVSGEVQGPVAARGLATEIVNSFCFTQGTSCDYEASLWAAFVLDYINYDVKDFMPYLITMKDDLDKQRFLPESFLYFLTGKFEIELLLKQDAGLYWQESGNRYYDTALALWPFYYDSPKEKENSKYWLLGNQQKNGCWNEDLRYSTRDTAFLLYSIWPKESSLPPERCEDASDCFEIDEQCQPASCVLGKCFYEYVSCGDDDGCCNPIGCNRVNDNDCPATVCESDYDCPEESESNTYCGDDDNVYQKFYSYECDVENDKCIQNVEEEIVEYCYSSEYCDAGECKTGTGDICETDDDCDSGYKCVNGDCVPEGGETDCSFWNRKCPTGLKCDTDTWMCVPVECDEDYDCSNYTEYSEPYCLNDDIYEDVDSYYCDIDLGECNIKTEEELVENCALTEYCDLGECKSIEEKECSFWNRKCPTGFKCDSDTWMCVPVECDEDYDCSNETDSYDSHCYNGDVYKYIDSYSCDIDLGECVIDTDEELFDTCNSSEYCDLGECIFADECEDDDDCASDEFCNAYGLCEKQQEPECYGDDDCMTDYSCVQGECVYIPPKACTFNFQCTDADECEKGICKSGVCVYELLGCINNDGCCNPGCVYSTDNDCDPGEEPECTIDSQCSKYNDESNPYCLNNDVYKDVSNWTCEDEICVENVKEVFIEDCGTDGCYAGECSYDPPPSKCIFNFECKDADECEKGICKSGVCVYELLGCIDNDDCCNPGCVYSTDNDCDPGEEPECTIDSQCSKYNKESDIAYCLNNDVYTDISNWTCKDEICVEDIIEKLVEDCGTDECYAGECYSEYECDDDYDCDYPSEFCNSYGECEESTECDDDYDCDYLYEFCNDDGICEEIEECDDDYDCDYPYEFCNDYGECEEAEGCDDDYDCDYPDEFCNDDGVCETILDCEDEEYFCMSKANCENNDGTILENYICTGVYSCCDTEIPSKTCWEDYSGEICDYGEDCVGGTTPKVSDTMSGETCCVGGICEEATTTNLTCSYNGGTCTNQCGKCEEENSIYTCSNSGDICCVDKEKCGGGGWILIIILVILIILAVLGIVFRDKLRTQWVKLKDKLGGKKEKKKFEMPMTSHHPTPQGRILPRRILPPSQQHPGFPIRRPFPSQHLQQPINRTASPTTAQQTHQTQQAKTAQPSTAQQTHQTQQAKTAQPSTSQKQTKHTVQQPAKKTEEKPKGDLEEVLKKLREIGK